MFNASDEIDNRHEDQEDDRARIDGLFEKTREITLLFAREKIEYLATAFHIDVSLIEDFLNDIISANPRDWLEKRGVL